MAERAKADLVSAVLKTDRNALYEASIAGEVRTYENAMANIRIFASEQLEAAKQ